MIFTKWFHKQVKKYLIHRSKNKRCDGFVAIEYVWNGYIFIILLNKFGKYKELKILVPKTWKSINGLKKYFVAVVTIWKLYHNHKKIMEEGY